MTSEDKQFFQQLGGASNHPMPSAVRKGSNADEELREMQLRILQEDSEETQKSVLNPFVSHQYSVAPFNEHETAGKKY